MQKPVMSALQRIAAAKIATSWVNQAAAVQEQLDTAAYGVLPEPNPPSEQLALAVKNKIKEEMEEVPQKLHGRRRLSAREGSCQLAVSMNAGACEAPQAAVVLPPLLDSARSMKTENMGRRISFAVHKVVSLEDVPHEVCDPTGCLTALVFPLCSHLRVCSPEETGRKDSIITIASLAVQDDSVFDADGTAPPPDGGSPSRGSALSLRRFLTRSRQTVTYRGDSNQPHRPSVSGGPLDTTTSDADLVLGADAVQYSHPSEAKILPTRSVIHRQVSEHGTLYYSLHKYPRWAIQQWLVC